MWCSTRICAWPLLFLLYVNDFSHCSKAFDFHLFADDSNLFRADKSLDLLQTCVNNELKRVHSWLCANKLSLNIDKTNFVIFHPRQKKIINSISLNINNKPIKQKDSIKYLGIIMDSNLSWKEHIKQLSKKISRGIGLISKLRHYVSKCILTQLYYSLIYPFLTYGVIIWANTYVSTLKPIIILQKKAIRIMTFSKYDDHTSPLFKNVNILKFSDIIHYHNSLFLFKFHSNMLPIAFQEFFVQTSTRHKYNTRLASSSSYYIPPVRTNYGKFNIRFNGAIIWNNIDESFKRFNLFRFKREIKNAKIASY